MTEPIKYCFKEAIKDILIAKFPEINGKISQIPATLLAIQNEQITELKHKAGKIGFCYGPVWAGTINALLYRKSITTGLAAKKFCDLAVLAMHSLEPSLAFSHPADFLDETRGTRDELEYEISKMEPPKETLVTQTCHDREIDLAICPMGDEDHFDWIAGKQVALYGKDAIDRDKYREWHKANPCGFFIFYFNRRIVGHLTLLPFREDFFLPYKQGLIEERKLGGEAIWKPEERSQITSLYVESYILEEKHEDILTPRIRARFVDMAREVADLEHIEAVYAMDATALGTNTILKMGFEPLKPLNAAREDGHTMYRAALRDIEERSKITAARFVSKWARNFLRDLSRICNDAPTSRLSHNAKSDFARTIEELRMIAREASPSRNILSQHLDILDDLLIRMRFTQKTMEYPGIVDFYYHCKEHETNG